MIKFDPDTDVLALDFDGVIVDSIEECLVVAYNALAIHQRKTERVAGLDELDAESVEEARRIRNFIRHGQDYVFIHYALQQKISIGNQGDFDRFLGENEFLNAEFRRLFYAERERFLNDEPARWLALNPFYRGMREFVAAFQAKERFYIITTKLKENVQAIFEGAGINFINENILSADQKLSKPRIISQLLNKHHLPAAAFHFVDDQVDTLIKAQVTGVNLYLARWGYNNDDQVQKAGNERLCVLSLKEFLQKFRR